MAEGTVKWFDDAKGYGFITPAEARMTRSCITRTSTATASSRSRRERR